jgi:DNA adenine methylase
MSQLKNISSKPFLKWAGGKAKLVPILSEFLGESERLVEPFVGSGAVFMGT